MSVSTASRGRSAAASTVMRLSENTSRRIMGSRNAVRMGCLTKTAGALDCASHAPVEAGQTMSTAARTPESRFSDRVENYIRYRPTYPPAIMDMLRRETGLESQSVIADIGSGTGISAELFLRDNCT